MVLDFTSLLYVPGNNMHMMEKSLSSAATAVIFDLEDAIPIEQKTTARDTIRKFYEINNGFKSKDHKSIGIRTNAVNTKFFADDLDLVINIGADFVVIPKWAPDQNGALKNIVLPLIVLIENYKGLLGIRKVIDIPALIAIGWGAADFALSVGGDCDFYLWDTKIPIDIVTFAREFNKIPLDCVFFDLKDEIRFTEHLHRGIEMGFEGKQVIHPDQATLAGRIFKPSLDEYTEAKNIVSIYKQNAINGTGAMSYNGMMIDKVNYSLSMEIIKRYTKNDKEGKK